MKISANGQYSVESLEDPRNSHDAKALMKNVELKNIIYRMRTEAKLSQADVAKILGVTPPAVNRLEKRSSHASFHTLKRYAKACGFDLHLYYSCNIS